MHFKTISSSRLRFISFFVLCLLFFTSKVWAIGFGENIKTIPLAYDESSKTLMLNRGTSDDIAVGEHLRLYHSGAFVARAYALEVSSHRSVWIVYQIYNAIALKDKLEIVATRLSTRYVPNRVRAIAQGLRIDEVKANLEGMAPAPESEPEPLKLGYEEAKELDKETIPIADTGGKFAFNPRVDSDVDQFKEDEKDNFNATIQASPIKFSSPNHAREIAYGVNISSSGWENKELQAHYNYSTRRSKLSNFSAGGTTIVTSSSYDAGITFDRNKIYNDWTYFMFVSWKRERDGTIYPLRYSWSGGIAGIKYDFYESEKITDLSLSYIPVMEFEMVDIPDSRSIQTGVDEFGDPIFIDQPYVRQNKTQKARHSFRFKFKAQPTEKFSIGETLWYKPFHDFANKNLDLEDCKLTNDFTINYNINANTTLGYQNAYAWDITQKRLNSLPSSSMDHIFTIAYNFAF